MDWIQRVPRRWNLMHTVSSLYAVHFSRRRKAPTILQFLRFVACLGWMLSERVWNKDTIRAEDIKDIDLHFLSSELNRLSDEMHILLKSHGCFVTSRNEAVFGYWSHRQAFRCQSRIALVMESLSTEWISWTNNLADKYPCIITFNIELKTKWKITVHHVYINYIFLHFLALCDTY